VISLSGHSLPAIFAGSLVIFLFAIEAGHRCGARVEKDSNISTLEAAVLGLLALMISFTFSMALNRFEARRDALLSEANAIGTAALRARLLPSPYSETSLKLFKDYAQIRLDLVGSVNDPSAFASAIRRSNDLQEGLWLQAQSVLAKDKSMAPTGLYIQALNETFDNQQKRLAILANQVPDIVYLALYGVAVVALSFTGYAGAPGKHSWRLPAYVTGSLVAAVILLIQDLDRPSAGFIAVNQQPMIDTANAVEGYVSRLTLHAPP
jgi:hypothetical protein